MEKYAKPLGLAFVAVALFGFLFQPILDIGNRTYIRLYFDDVGIAKYEWKTHIDKGLIDIQAKS